MAGIAWRRYRLCATLAVSLAVLLGAHSARAFDFFGLFGEKPPAVSQHALPYSIAFDVGGGASDVKAALQEASTLYRLRQDAPVDAQSLLLRASGDLPTMLNALWGAGYYNARLDIDLAGHRLRPGTPPPAGTAEAIAGYRGRALVPIKVSVQPGPLFHLRSIRVVDALTGGPFPLSVLPPHAVRLTPGLPARAADIRAARAALVDWFRAQSYPLARVTATKPVVYHRTQAMDVTLVVARGPRAGFGPIAVAGTSHLPPEVVRSQIYIEPGSPYSPAALSGARSSILKLPAVGSVRIREAKTLDAHGRLPVTVEVADRKPHVVGFAARYSTLDGPDVSAYWQHRNLFGGGESLRLEGEAFLPPETHDSFLDSLKNYGWSDVGGRFKASFVKPALQGTRNDLLLDGMFEKTRTGGNQFGGYTSTSASASAAVRHRFSASASAQVGLAGETGTTRDALGTIDYRLIGIPAAAQYDSTDRALDPSKGLRVTASLAAYPSFLGSSVGIVESKLQASTYYAVDPDAKLVLAGRVTAGSVAGAGLEAIPANHRFYAGGGGSVRGFRYQGLGPLDANGQVIGGRSLFAASFEARWKVTDTIGLVPFLDMGEAFRASVPDFSQPLRYAAGLGLRYYTAVGPIRVDLAFPLNPRPGDASYAVYVGIGQAF